MVHKFFTYSLVLLGLFSRLTFASADYKSCSDSLAEKFAARLNLNFAISNLRYSSGLVTIKKYGRDLEGRNDTSWGQPYAVEHSVLPHSISVKAKNLSSTFDFSYKTGFFTAKRMVFGEGNPKITNECCIDQSEVSVRDTVNQMSKKFGTGDMACTNYKNILNRQAKEAGQELEISDTPFSLAHCREFNEEIINWKSESEITRDGRGYDPNSQEWHDWEWKEAYEIKGCK